MRIGELEFEPFLDDKGLVASVTAEQIIALGIENEVFVSAIDASLADTAAFCEHYKIGLDISANCVVLQAKRAERTWFVACIVLATDRADVNKTIKKHVDARKISFASMELATTETKMEYGGITPIGLPADWSILIDENVMQHEFVIIGSGVRGSKLALNPKVFKALGNVQVFRITI